MRSPRRQHSDCAPIAARYVVQPPPWRWETVSEKVALSNDDLALNELELRIVSITGLKNEQGTLLPSACTFSCLTTLCLRVLYCVSVCARARAMECRQGGEG